MSCCGGSCGCGSGCKCGSGCGGCGMYPDMENTTTFIIIDGVARVKNYEGSAENATEGGKGCRCGANCKCDPCNCEKHGH